MKHLVAVLLIVSVALLGGCKGGGREAGLVGTWNASQDKGGGTLTLNEDKSFTIPIPNGGGDIKGKWALEGDTIALRPEVFGKKTKAEALKELDDQAKKAPQFASMVEPIRKMLNQMDLVLAKDDKSGTITIQIGATPQTVTYTKQEKK